MGGVGGVRAARARREGVVTVVEVQAWCAASVVWRVMREKKKRREKGKRVDTIGCHPSNTTKRKKRRRREEEEEKKKSREEEKQI